MSSAYGARLGVQANPQLIGSVTNFTIDASTKAISWLIDPQTTSAIDTILFRYGARTGTPPVFRIACEGIDGSGNPDGSVIGGASATFTPPADTSWNGTHREIALGSTITRSGRGDSFAITIRHSSGTIDASNSASFSLGYTDHRSGVTAFPGVRTLTGGTWTASTALGAGAIGWKSGATVFGSPIVSIYATATANTAGHRSGGCITIPTDYGVSTTVEGLSLVGKYGAAAGSFKVGIWDTSWNVVASRTIDSDWTAGLASPRSGTFYFDSPVTLTNGVKYYVGLEVVSGTVFISGIVCDGADDVAAYEMGANMGLVTWNGTTTTETASTYPMVQLICSDLALPSGGGLLVPRGLTGGFAQ